MKHQPTALPGISRTTLMALAIAVMVLAFSPSAHGQTLAEYTAYPPFLNESSPPNILFIVDLGDQTIQSAYAGANHEYPVSFKSGTPTDSEYAANVTFDGAAGDDLASVNTSGALITGATTAAPSDTFDSSKTYYGFFDSLRCYVTDSNSFNYSAVKSVVPDQCATTVWDGNFLNWLAVRKKDVAYQALVGGTSLPASANVDGTANSLASEGKTGENGSNDTCANNAKSCWRYVKFVPAATLTGRVPTSLPNPAVSGTNVGDGSAADAGRFFGLGEGTLYVNGGVTPDPFDTAASNQYALKVDLTTEPDVPSGTGSENDHCNVGETGYAGHLVCYKRDRSLGLFQKLQLDNMHVGIMFVNAGSGKAGRMEFDFDDSFNASTITGIRNEHIQTHSPLAEALYEGLCLFRKSQGPCYANSGSSATGYDTSTGSAGDPFYFADVNQMIPCCRSFVLMISPGAATSDGTTPDLQVPFGDLFAGINLGVDTSGAAGDRLDDVALYGQTNDIRDQTAASPVGLTGTQKVTFYAVNAMGGPTGATLLASAAKYGGFVDVSGDNLPDSSGQTCTYPAGSDLGSGSSTSSLEWDENQDCLPDTYFEASEGADLETKIQQAIAKILRGAASGSAVSVLANSSSGEGAVFQSFFFPAQDEGGGREITWTGHTQSLFLDAFGNLREDTNGDGKLVYDQDHIIRTRVDATTNDVVVDRFVDADGNGLADGTTPSATVGLRDVNGIWEAGDRLAQTASATRKIKTWVDQDNNGLVAGTEWIDFTTTHATDLAPYLRADAAGTFTADNIINFIRGDQIAGMRDRLLAGGDVWKLGDAIHGGPTSVGAPAQRYGVLYGDSSYTAFLAKYHNRRQVVYLGANDGMLHAFNGGFYHRGDDPGTSSKIEHGWFSTTATGVSNTPPLGEELFGFIPQELLPHLKWLTQPDYTHVYYVDLTPKITDARIFTPDADHPNGWGTILMGGFRLGGSCGACTSATGAPPMTVSADFNRDGDTVDAGDTRTFYSAFFVLDITNPESPNYPKLLWSFTSSDMGLSTSVPSMLRVNPSGDTPTDNTNATWYLVVGSGPTGYDGSIAQAGKLYAIDLDAGPGSNNSNVITMTAESLNAFIGSPVTVDTNYDYRVDAAYMGSVIHDGTLPWRGKLYRLTINDCTSTPCSTATWGIDGGSGMRKPTEVLDTFPSSGSLELGPVSAQPAVVIDDSSKTWLFAGTGRLYNATDGSNTEQQYFVGVKDPVLNGGCTESSATDCHADDLVNMSSAEVCVVGIGDCGGGTDQVTGVTGATSFPSLITKVAAKDGWYTTLPASGERALFRPVAIAGLVLFVTYTPSGNLCDPEGSSQLYALYYLTGSAYSSPVIGGGSSSNPLSGTTTKNGKDYVNRAVSLGSGMAVGISVHKGVGTGDGKAGAFIQKSLGQVIRAEIDTSGALASRYKSWLLNRDWL